jgi:hypothetical protein
MIVDRIVPRHLGLVLKELTLAFVDRPQRLPLQTTTHPLMAHLHALRAQPVNDARTPIAALTGRVQRRHLCIQPRIGLRASARRASPPLQKASARYRQQSAHPAHRIIVAMLFDPGVSHRDSFAKYAAAVFTISRSSLALASSRRSRAFSASTSDTERFTAVAALPSEADPPSRLRRTQFVTVDCGIRVAWLPRSHSSTALASLPPS